MHDEVAKEYALVSALLDNFLETGVFVFNYQKHKLIFTNHIYMLKFVAKKENRHVVLAEILRNGDVSLEYPKLKSTEPLLTPLFLVGEEVWVNNELYTRATPVNYMLSNNKVKAHFRGSQGMAAFQGWFSATQTNIRMRKALGLPLLPPKVTP